MHIVGFTLLVLVLVAIHFVHKAEGRGALTELAVAGLILFLFSTITGIYHMKKEQYPEPARLMRERWNDVVGKLPDTYRVPVWSPKDLSDIDDVARAMGRADKSDPFAYGRAKLHMVMGYTHPSTIGGDAKQMDMSNKGFLALGARPQREAR